MIGDFRCELHMHTYYSDGFTPPADLLTHAAEIGCSTVAITDHDTADGVRFGRAYAQALGLELIPAIEFTSRWDEVTPPGTMSGDVDVLGYFVNLDDPGFRALEKAALADIEARIAACCVPLTQAGYPISLADVRAQNPRYAGARQLHHALVEKGCVRDVQAAAELFAAHWPAIRLSNFHIRAIIAGIRAAGGVAILAHPSHILTRQTDANGNAWLTAEHVAALVEMGLDGLEVYHRTVVGEARTHFQALADQFDLLVTGGSDEHGWSPELQYLGQQPVTAAMVAALRARAAERQRPLN